MVQERMIIGKKVIFMPSVSPSLKAKAEKIPIIEITMMMIADIRATSSRLSLER